MIYPEFPFESEAEGDSLIGMYQTKDAYNFNSCVVLGIKWHWEYN